MRNWTVELADIDFIYDCIPASLRDIVGKELIGETNLILGDVLEVTQRFIELLNDEIYQALILTDTSTIDAYEVYNELTQTFILLMSSQLRYNPYNCCSRWMVISFANSSSNNELLIKRLMADVILYQSPPHYAESNGMLASAYSYLFKRDNLPIISPKSDLSLYLLLLLINQPIIKNPFNDYIANLGNGADFDQLLGFILR